jgi:hypothetical protein
MTSQELSLLEWRMRLMLCLDNRITAIMRREIEWRDKLADYPTIIISLD